MNGLCSPQANPIHFPNTGLTVCISMLSNDHVGPRAFPSIPYVVAVDPDSPRPEAPRQPVDGAHVVAEDPGGQAVVGVICTADDLSAQQRRQFIKCGLSTGQLRDIVT